jgi:uncharacterized protein
MHSRRLLPSVVMVSLLLAGTGQAASIEGEWVGGFRGTGDWASIQVRFGGSGTTTTGRADLPLRGERDILLRDVQVSGQEVAFELPGVNNNIYFHGRITDERISGMVRQGVTRGTFELLRSRRLTAAELTFYAGDFQASGDDVVLLYPEGNRLLFVDYRTGRLGRLFPLSDGRFVSGYTIAAGFPVEIVVAFERDEYGKAVSLTWERKGDRPRRLVERRLYRTEPVQIASTGGTMLEGRLLVPSTPGPHPAVVIVPGSGEATSDTLMPYADSLARHGIAVLVHDKRGSGRSTGHAGRAGLSELAADALASVAFLKTSADVRRDAIGLVGTSLGGWVAPLAASRSNDVKFIIVESAPAITPAQHERLRVAAQMGADRRTETAIQDAIAYMDRKFEVARTGRGWDDLVRAAAGGERDGWIGYVNHPASFESLRWNWDHVLSFDPAPALAAVRVPVLALYGELDRVVDPQINAEQLKHTLRRGGNEDVTVRVLSGANHNFLSAVSGGPGELPYLRRFVSGYFGARVDWIKNHVDQAPGVMVAGAVQRPTIAATVAEP